MINFAKTICDDNAFVLFYFFVHFMRLIKY